MLNYECVKMLFDEARKNDNEIYIVWERLSDLASAGKISFEEANRIWALWDSEKEANRRLYHIAEKALTHRLDQVRPRLPFMQPAPTPTEEEEAFLEASWNKIFNI